MIKYISGLLLIIFGVAMMVFNEILDVRGLFYKIVFSLSIMPTVVGLVMIFAPETEKPAPKAFDI